jgi:hypothetical protein
MVIPLTRPGIVAGLNPLLLGKVTMPVMGKRPLESGVPDWVSVRLAVPEMGVVVDGEAEVRAPVRIPV